MIDYAKQSGFTAVELLITLFVAAIFLIAGYQLYAVIIKDGGSTRAQSQANNVNYDYLQRYAGTATTPCTTQTPLTNAFITVPNLSNVKVTVAISCPYPSTPAVSKVQVTVQYNNPQQAITNALFVSQ